MTNTTYLSLPHIPVIHDFGGYQWVSEDDGIYAILEDGTKEFIRQPIPLQDEIVQQHNMNLIVGISDHEYNREKRAQLLGNH